MTNGDDLIGYLQCSPLPDMILLDINLPGKDGLTLLKEIRQNDLWRDVPVVMFSVAHDPYTIKQAYELGANFYLHKPALYSTFRNALRTVFGLTRAQLLNKRSLSDYLLS